MANPFGDRDETASKRPAQTIEGTATEVAVEPAPGDPPPAAKESGAAEDRAAGAGDEHDHAAEALRPRFAGVKSFMTHLAAGLAGGLIGVAAADLASNGRGPGEEGGQPPAVTALEQRIAKLESAPPPSPDTQAVAALESRVAALEDGEKADAAKLSQLSDRAAELDTALKSLAKTAAEGGSVADAAAISQAVEEAENRLSAKIDDALAKGKAADAAAVEGLAKEVAELQAKLKALTEAQLAAGDANVSQPELAALIERLGKLEALLPELAGTIDKEAAGAKSAALAIAFANLRAAVSDGRSYPAELDTIVALAPALNDLGVLPAYAERGIPTVSKLSRAFAAAREEAVAASAPPTDGSVVGSLMASAESLVKIRRIDEAPTDEGAEAALSRAEKALANDDLAVAVKEVEKLQGKPREAFASWLGEARARLSAGETLTRLEGALLISLSGDTEPTEP
ncbi:MAG: mitofilin family membrane protein [Methyloceanibacter sp.]